MRGCAFGALRSFGGWLLCVAGIMVHLHTAYGLRSGSTLGVALFAGTFAFVGFGLVISVAGTLRQRTRLRAGLDGIAPVDGREVALVGRIAPTGTALVAPLDGARCVAYHYEIFQHVGTGKAAQRLVHCKGVGLAPATIATAAGSFRLLAVPEFEGEPPDIGGASGLARVAEYLRTTTFSPKKTSARELHERWSDSDGAYRSDVAYTEDLTQIELSRCGLAQGHVPPGAAVCVLGLYSQAEGGIVANPNWGRPTRLLLGDPEQVARTLRSQVIARTVLALVCGALLAGTLAAFVASLPQR